jgi:hypothetical protein
VEQHGLHRQRRSGETVVKERLGGRLNPNSALDKCGNDVRLVINGLQKPLKRFVHRD